MSLALAAGILLLLALSCCTAWVLDDHRAVVRERVTLRIAVSAVKQVVAVLREAESAQRAYLLAPTEQYRGPVVAARAQMAALLADMATSVSAAGGGLDVAQVRQLAERKMAFVERMVQLQQTGQGAAAAAAVASGEGGAIFGQLRALVDAWEAGAVATLSQQWQRSETLAGRATVAATCGATLSALLLLLLNLRLRRLGLDRQQVQGLLAAGIEEFRALVDAMPVGVVAMAQGGRIVFANERARALLPPATGALNLPEAMQRGRAVVAGTETPYPAHRTAVARALAGEAATVTDMEILRPDGARIRVEGSARPVRDGNGAVMLAVGVFDDVTERVAAEARQRDLQSSATAETLLQMHDKERRQVAMDLHDEVGQLLTAISLQVAALEAGGGGDRTSGLAAQNLVAQAVRAVRQMALDLCPPMLPSLGLPATVRWLIGRLQPPTGCSVELRDDIGGARFAAGLELAAYRIAQEALTNALRHAGATRIEVTLRSADNQLLVEVRDNGHGFAPAVEADKADSFGLLSMRQRAEALGGALHIGPDSDTGTLVAATLPAGPRPTHL